MNFIQTVYASPEPVEAYNTGDVHAEVVSHGNAEESVTASLGLNGQLFLFQLLNFALVAAILWFLILKPLTKKLEERKKIIDDSIDNAKRVETNLQMSEQKFQEKIDEAKVEANKIIEKTQIEGEGLTEKMKDNAKKEIELLIDQAKRNIQIEKENMAQGLKEETVNLVILTVEKILQEKIDGKKDNDLISGILKDLKK